MIELGDGHQGEKDLLGPRERILRHEAILEGNSLNGQLIPINFQPRTRPMDRLKRIRNTVLVALILAVTGYVLVAFYPQIFARKVIGVITAVERVSLPVAMVNMTGETPAAEQMYSYAVGVRETSTGEIVTSSTEERQWAVAKPGQCVEARFFPYPPWVIEKWGTYHNARLLKLADCPATE